MINRLTYIRSSLPFLAATYPKTENVATNKMPGQGMQGDALIICLNSGVDIGIMKRYAGLH
jgi:hypothetical protein